MQLFVSGIRLSQAVLLAALGQLLQRRPLSAANPLPPSFLLGPGFLQPLGHDPVGLLLQGLVDGRHSQPHQPPVRRLEVVSDPEGNFSARGELVQAELHGASDNEGWCWAWK